MLKQYKFTIYYNLKKNNGKTNILNRKNDYIKSKEIFNHNILKINNDKYFSANKIYEVNAIIKILEK